MLKRIISELDHPYINLPKDYDDAGWVSARLVELLPLEYSHKLWLLQEGEPLRRLGVLLELMTRREEPLD